MVLIVVLGIAFLLLLVLKCKLHAFIALLIASIAVGVAAGMPLTDITASIQNGMGGTLGTVAIIVGLGAVFGQMLEASGGAQALAKSMIRCPACFCCHWIHYCDPCFFRCWVHYPAASDLCSGIQNKTLRRNICISPDYFFMSDQCICASHTGSGSNMQRIRRKCRVGHLFWNHYFHSPYTGGLSLFN